MNTFDGSLAAGQARPGATLRLLEWSSASGKLLRAIPVGPASAAQTQYFCGVLWASPNGCELLTQCGTRQQEVINGKVTVTKLPWTFLASQSLATSAFAW